MPTRKERESDRKWEMFDNDQFYQIMELLRIAGEFKLCTGSFLVKDVTRAISREVEKGLNDKMYGVDRQALHAHPILSQLLVYSRGLSLGPRSMLAEDIEMAVTKVILDHLYPTSEEDSEPDSSPKTQVDTPKKSESKTGASDEATGDAVESSTKGKRNFFKEANEIAGDAKL